MAKRGEQGPVFLQVAAIAAAVMVLLSAQVRPAVAAVDGGYNKIIEEIVHGIVEDAKAVAPGLIRLGFHDCFVRGCDGSVLLHNTPVKAPSTAAPSLAGKTEKESPFNGGLRGIEVIETIRTKLKANGTVVSCADAIQFAAREATKVLSNEKIAYPINGPGRTDGVKSSAVDPGNNNLPAPTHDFATLLRLFAAKGFNLNELVALSGAHNVGQTNGGSFAHREDANSSEINLNYRREVIRADLKKNRAGTFRMNIRDLFLQRTKIGYAASMAVLGAPADTFDNSFYHANLLNMVRFKSDWELRTNTDAEALMNRYKNEDGLWEEHFSAAMTKLSSLNITATDGPAIWEVGSRVKCSDTNFNSYSS